MTPVFLEKWQSGSFHGRSWSPPATMLITKAYHCEGSAMASAAGDPPSGTNTGWIAHSPKVPPVAATLVRSLVGTQVEANEKQNKWWRDGVGAISPSMGGVRARPGCGPCVSAGVGWGHLSMNAALRRASQINPDGTPAILDASSAVTKARGHMKMQAGYLISHFSL